MLEGRIALDGQRGAVLQPDGTKGVGEIGIVGKAATTNAVCHATDIRVRDLPTVLDKLLP